MIALATAAKAALGVANVSDQRAAELRGTMHSHRPKPRLCAPF